MDKRLRRPRARLRIGALFMSVLLAVSGWTLPVVALPDGDDQPLPTQTASSTAPEDTQQSPPSASASAQPTASELNSASPSPSASADPSDKPAPSSSPSAPVSSQDATASQSPTPSADALPIGAMTAEQIEAMIAELPTAEQIACADFGGDKQAVYDQMQAVFDALDLLAEGESIDPAAQEKLVALAEYFNQAMTLATITTVGSPNTQNYIKDKLIESSMTGPYRFNFAGNTNCSGKYNNTNVVGVPNHSNTTYEKNCGTLPANIGGQNATNTNSSSSTLTATTGTSGIAKAYLVVALTQYGGSVTSKTAPLGQYGFYMVGPKGEYRHFYPSTIYQDNVNTRVSAYFDVTAWVRGQGYGTYTAVNLPYTAMNGNTAADWNNFVDCFASWKLIIVEEDTNLPLRMVKLQLGGISVSPATPANVKIEGDGLVIKDNPTGELIFSLDGQDPDSAAGGTQQSLQYNTSKVTTYKSIYSSLRSTVHFFTGQILKYGSTSGLGLNPGNTRPYYDHGNGGQGTLPNVNGGKSFNYANHDLEIMAINDSKNAGGIKLNGKETFVSVRTDTTSAPTILSALGLTADIVVPEFASDIQVENLTQHYSTKDAGYGKQYTAVGGDALRVTVTCKNTSTSSAKIGLQSAKVTVPSPCVITDKNQVTASYVSPSGGRTPLTVTVSSDGKTVTAAATSSITIVRDGYFEVIYTGAAPTVSGFTTYDNRVSVEGNFVDDTGKVYPTFHLDNVGVKKVETYADVLKYPVTVEKDGPGAVTGAGKYPYNGSAKVTWTPDADTYTRLLVVDGVVRDDLVTDGKTTLNIDNQAHSVFVAFVAGQRPDKELCRISTITDGHAEITPSRLLLKGADHEVTWAVEPGYSVSEVLLDGYPYPVSDTGTIAFKGVLSDHQVEIRTVSNYAYIQTIAWGPGTISNSVSVAKGDDHTVNWSPNSGANISTVTVDGRLIYDANNPTARAAAPTIQSFMNIQENHLVEVLFRDDKAPALDQLLVNTQIVNGPGTITPSQVIAPNSNVTIQWAPSSGYRVSKVVFTKGGVRQEVAVSENQLPLNNVDEDCLIQVYLESSDAPKAEDLFDIVTSLTGGPGAITPTERDILRGQERTVAWSVDPGYRVQSVVIDGVTRDDLLAAGSYTFSDIQQDHSLFVVVTSDQSPATDEEFVRVNTEAIGNGTISDSVRVHRGDHHRVTWEPAPGESVLRVEVDGVERPDLLTAGGVDFTDIQDHHQVSVTFSDTTHNPPPEPDELLRVDTDLYGGPGTITASCTVYPGEDQLVNWSTQAGYEVQAVIVNGQMRDDLIATGSVAFTDIQENQHVVVILKDAPEEPQKPQTILLISTEQHGQGSITPSTTVSRGSDHVVTWVPADGWHIEKVYVDGLLQSDAVAQSGQMNFVDIVRNHHVEVFFAADDDPDNPNPPDDPDNPNPPDDPDAVEPFTVSTMISGGLGSITPTRHYPAGADALVSWQIDPRYDVARIYVDGELHNELIDDAKTGFISLDRDHDVQIILIPLRPIDTQLVKSAFNLTHRDGPNVVGDAVRYSLSVQNHTPDSQWDQVVLCDQLPLSLTLLPDSLTLYGPEPVGRPLDEGEYTFDEKTGKLTVPVGTIRGGETYTLVFDAVINSKAVSPTGGVSIQNLAVASGTDADGVPLPDVWSDAVIPGVDPGDPDPGVQPLGPDGYVDKSAVLAEDAERLEVGQRIVYDIAVGNRLDGSMWADVRVRDLLPAGLTPDLDTLVVIDPQGRSIQPQRDAYALTDGMLTVCIGDIYGGEVYHIRFEAVINAQALESGIGNRAVAGGYTPDGKPTDPSAPDDPMPDGEGAIVIELPDPVYPAGFGPDDPIKGIAPVDTTPQPHTGDAFLPWLAGGICLAAAIALLVLLLTRKKRNKQTS